MLRLGAARPEWEAFCYHFELPPRRVSVLARDKEGMSRAACRGQVSLPILLRLHYANTFMLVTRSEAISLLESFGNWKWDWPRSAVLFWNFCIYQWSFIIVNANQRIKMRDLGTRQLKIRLASKHKSLHLIPMILPYLFPQVLLYRWSCSSSGGTTSKTEGRTPSNLPCTCYHVSRWRAPHCLNLQQGMSVASFPD